MTTDLLIIGGGPGGYHAAEYAAQAGLRVVLAERVALGGTCLHSGCIPTKSLLHDAHKRTPWADAMQRKADVVAQLAKGVETLMQMRGVTVMVGEAALIDATHARVGDETVEAAHIIIATGSTTRSLALPPGDHSRVVTSSELLLAPTPPKSLCIVGAGVIGLEMASIFTSYGTQVSIVEYMDECLPQMDQEIARRLRRQMERQGISFSLRTAVTAIDGTRVTGEGKRGTVELEADAILVAVGRAPLTAGLGLEAAGVDFTKRGITVDANQQTNVPSIYAIGDVTGQAMLAHAATAEARIAMDHILGRPTTTSIHVMPAAVFTTPEVAAVGLTEEDCKQQGVAHTVHKAMLRANGRALATEQTDGLVKLIVGEDDHILGCHAYGADAAAMVQEVAAMMTLGATRTQLASVVHIHPTISEVLVDAASANK